MLHLLLCYTLTRMVVVSERIKKCSKLSSVCVCVCVHVRMYACVCMNVSLYVWIFVHACVCMGASMRFSVCM